MNRKICIFGNFWHIFTQIITVLSISASYTRYSCLSIYLFKLFFFNMYFRAHAFVRKFMRMRGSLFSHSQCHCANYRPKMLIFLFIYFYWRIHGACLRSCLHRHVTIHGPYFSSVKKNKSCTEHFQATLRKRPYIVNARTGFRACVEMCAKMRKNILIRSGTWAAHS